MNGESLRRAMGPLFAFEFLVGVLNSGKLDKPPGREKKSLEVPLLPADGAGFAPDPIFRLPP
jgi:hypothetical protein